MAKREKRGVTYRVNSNKVVSCLKDYGLRFAVSAVIVYGMSALFGVFPDGRLSTSLVVAGGIIAGDFICERFEWFKKG